MRNLRRCFLCDFVCKQDDKLNRHLISNHSTTLQNEYTRINHSGVAPKCQCGCDEPVPWIGWRQGFGKFLRGHNARVDSTFSDPKQQQKMTAKRVEGYKTGKYAVWNSGKTKETDERIKQTALKISKTIQSNIENGTHQTWRDLSEERQQEVLKGISETKKKNYASGKTKPWNLGESKFTNSLLAEISQKISDTHLSREGHGGRHSIEKVKELLNNSGFVPAKEIEYQNKYSRLTVLCQVCNYEIERSATHLFSGAVCPKCHPESQPQFELFEIVQKIEKSVILSDRTVVAPLELDIYVPGKKIAIEFNGLWWHSEKYRDQNYHWKKTKLCDQQGVKLFHVFSDEWREHRDIIVGMIKQRLGACDNRTFARNTTVGKVKTPDRRNFFKGSHLDGDVNATVAFGLYDKTGRLVSCLSLRKSFHKKWQNRWEIARFASVPGEIVVGGLGKLVSAAKKWAIEDGRRSVGFMTYVDLRNGTGSSYEKVGFQQSHITKPRFWWTKGKHKIDRFAVRADKKTNRSENEVASQMGVFRVYGCPNRVMLLDFDVAEPVDV